ncbi:MAG: phosphoribosylamine--glycine ligase [candidate division Zixibacteria bacterium]|nr:phosphoribosylamine--glycine ligase [candidate division Zixibacteria bacterium]
MKILVVGSGGREHALVWKLKSSPLVKRIYVAPGNAGIGLMADNVNLKVDDLEGVARFEQKKEIDLTVVGPELPLTLGIVDLFEKRGLRIFGPSKKAAEIEGSKAFAKEFMRKYHIPTASFVVFDDKARALEFAREAAYPLFIKASGLAAGKGAVMAPNAEEAAAVIERMMGEKVFGEAGAKIVIEDRLAGQEVTIMAFTDGKTILPMLSSQDHKQIFDGDQGPNTGGMGAYCPVPYVSDQMMQTIREQILEPAIYGLEKEGRRYKGILYAGLMITPVGPKVIEFNCRFGDPETQVVLPLLKSDLADIFIAIVDGNLNIIEPVWKEGAAVCVVMTSRGYPDKYETGAKITGVRTYRENHAYLFHAGTRHEGNTWYTAGGRVLGVTAVNQDIRSAVKAVYDTMENIHFEGAHFRRDIAYQAMK